ncbi:DUF177 domain-containing protein [Halanaerobium sp. Z-7514]|uniref:DUF177 domain-containing protein n=1 Tax=Halanaerobium polyolivorans TaxID=2886943 RepID=A0AAW4WZB5_9FIRM|nr:DUF177 domain-containing protein [Halanaerobium polyolivorans]MCC3144799.1 DUF177 domain-containing protein [Halanaerobium polyolivorans]RQD73065.1 MAG: DUF177 domain-containing protein [Halanaerobium sp. MSAO_Bac5]
MYINLNDLGDIGGKKNVSMEIEIADLNFRDQEVEIKDDIKLEIEIYHTSDSFLVEGEMEVNLILSCSRCLENYRSSALIEISEEVLKKDMEDLEKLFIDEIIVDNIILSLPIKPLCSEDCKGLCPQCGQDLNEAECDCEIESIDPRLEKLKEFYDD